MRGVTLTLTDRPSRSQRKAKGSGHLRRAEILEAAERVFVEQGYEGATIRRIADEVGLSSTALYMHFRDKAQILDEICAGHFRALNAINEALLAEAADPVDRVRRMLEGYIDFAYAHPNTYRLVFCSPVAVKAEVVETDGEAHAIGARTFELFSEGVRRIGEAGRLRTPDAAVAAQTSWAACHGIVSLLLTRPTIAWADRGTLRDTMLDVVFTGLTRP